jgi:excisionase family DNA binding protein
VVKIEDQLEFASIAFPRDRKMLTVDEVALRLGVDKQTVLNHIDRGTLQAINIGVSERKYWRIPVEAYAQFLARRHSFVVESPKS